jgi:lauroyl/myristoyl acyltransferase
LPVTAHIEGRTQVITIHPPIPAVDRDPQRDVALCRDVLAALLDRYVRDYPEQCCRLVFGD